MLIPVNINFGNFSFKSWHYWNSPRNPFLKENAFSWKAASSWKKWQSWNQSQIKMADISKAVCLKGKLMLWFQQNGRNNNKDAIQAKTLLSFVKYYYFMKMQAKINRLLQNIKCNFTTFSIDHKAYSLGYSKNANKSRYSLYLYKMRYFCTKNNFFANDFASWKHCKCNLQ